MKQSALKQFVGRWYPRVKFTNTSHSPKRRRIRLCKVIPFSWSTSHALSATALSWSDANGVLVAFAWAGDQVGQLFHTAAGWIEDAGAWAASALSSGVEVAGSFIAGLIDSGQAVLGVLADLPDTVNNVIDILSFGVQQRSARWLMIG